jgi:hypothetical protein
MSTKHKAGKAIKILLSEGPFAFARAVKRWIRNSKRSTNPILTA